MRGTVSSIATFTGKRFHLFSPKPDQICIEDIAHALSNLCRFTGHCKRFYSVGQHSWHASHLVPTEHALEGLMHDAAEAYVNDLSRPLKHDPRMDAYLELEGTIDTAIRTKYGLPIIGESPYMTRVVKDVDDKLVYTEGKQLTASPQWTDGHPTFDIVIPMLMPGVVERLFLERFKELIDAR